MDKEEQLIDSLLKEHAKNGGVDEKFISEVEERIDTAERASVIDLNQEKMVSEKDESADWKRGLGIGVAACAAICVAGTLMWKNQDHKQDVALSSGAASSQIEDELALVEEVGADEKLKEAERRPSSPNASSPKVIASNSASAIPVPVPSLEADEPQLDFGSGKDFGDGWGGADEVMAKKSQKPVVEAQLNGRRSRMLPELDRFEPIRQAPKASHKFGSLTENSFTSPADKESRRSTFSVDVDTASYTNVRKMIQQGRKVPADAVRIEEMVNYFDYQYAQPKAGGAPFAVQVDSYSCPWNLENKLVRVALQGKDIVRNERPASNLVFLLDVSGSMNASDKLPLLKQSLKFLLEEMDERDTISMVVYAGASGVVLPATKADDAGRVNILKAMDNLSSGGSTAGGAGIKMAYKLAQENFIKGGANRVILATDGDFNVGVSGTDELTKLVKQKALKGVDLSVLGFGSGNLNDEMLESITNNGNGNYSYIDTIKEGRKVLLEDMTGTLVTIAKDVKIQVEFNPEQVKEYRLIGYANRVLPNSAFLDKKADAGEIGAGHTVTAFYEIVPGKALDKSELDELRYAKKPATPAKPEVAESGDELAPVQHADELLYVKLAYKQGNERINDESSYLTVPLKVNDKSWEQADADFKFASSVALFGMVLRDSENLGDGNIDLVEKLAEEGKGTDGKGYREEFIQLVKKVKASKE